MKRLGDAELEIMLAVWGAGKAVNSVYVHDKLKGSRDWALPAVATSLNRLVEKGFLSIDKQGRTNLYSPLISEREYKAAESRGILDRLFGSSFKGLMSALYDGDRIGEKEIEELRSFLDEMEDK